jgi:hypothetical protein
MLNSPGFLHAGHMIKKSLNYQKILLSSGKDWLFYEIVH